MSKHNKKTYIVRAQGIAAMWYYNQIIAAWEESSGERIILHGVTAVGYGDGLGVPTDG